MKILIIDNAEPEDKNFNQPLLKAVSRLSAYDRVNYRDTPNTEQISRLYDGAILSGVPLSYDERTVSQRLPYMGWVPHARIPVLGICLGHQSIGVLFDASVEHGTEAEEGMRTISIFKEADPLFEAMSLRFEAKALHSCSISVPGNFELLAKSSGCLNEVMKHHERDIYGLQFHPELHEDSLPIFEKFVKISQNARQRKLDSDFVVTQ